MKPQELGRHTYISLESSVLKHSKTQHFEYQQLSRKTFLLLKDKNLIFYLPLLEMLLLLHLYLNDELVLLCYSIIVGEQKL